MIIKLPRRKIGYKALESKLFQLWVKDDALEIMDLTNKFYLIKFIAFFDYEYALMEGRDRS